MLADSRDRSERRRRLDRAWESFVRRGEIDHVSPEIARSWTRARGFLGIDPALSRAPLVDADELARRREQSDVLQIAEPILDDFSLRLHDRDHALAFFDGAACMLAVGGDPETVERLGDVNFCPGASWREDATGTTAPGTALAERRPVEVFASEHYVEAFHPWASAASPIVVRGAAEPLGIVAVTGPWDAAEPQTLLAAGAIAAVVEERIRGVQTVRAEVVRHALRCARAAGDALVAVDDRWRLLAANDAAHRRLALDPRELPALREKLSLLLPRGGAPPDEEFTFDWPGANDPRRRVTCAAVNHGGRVVGAILRVAPPPAAPAAAAFTARAARPAGPARSAPTSRYGFQHILGESEPLLEAIAHAHVAARNDLPVVIHGESGTGKELFAHGIHGESARGAGPFVAVNCGAIPAALIEAELFGYEAGTFTGGQRDGKAGRLEDAHGGTLFLDEVSELSQQAQTALLRVLQESEVVRLGGNAPRGVDVRVVVATNKDLAGEVEAGRFRQDLFFRLHVLTIEIPPLRNRGGDVAILARAFLAEAEERVGRSGLVLSDAAIAALAAHPWPGNVRELRNVVLRAAAVARGERVEPGDLHLVEVRAPAMASRLAPVPATGAWNGASHGATNGHETPAPPAEPEPERDELVAALDACNWNIARTATTLGVSRMTLYRRLRKYDISR